MHQNAFLTLGLQPYLLGRLKCSPNALVYGQGQEKRQEDGKERRGRDVEEKGGKENPSHYIKEKKEPKNYSSLCWLNLALTPIRITEIIPLA